MSTWHCCLISNFSMSLDQLPANPDYLWLDWLQCCAKNLKDVSVDRSSTLLLRCGIPAPVQKDHMKLHCSQGLAFPVPTKNRPKGEPLSDGEPMREGESIWEKGGLRAFKNQWKGKTCSLHSFLSKESH
ncbi:hypothetical protein Tco_0418319 [Tanacetum coccineum]